MPSIVVDAGPLIALFDRDDRHHRRAVEFIRDQKSRLVTNLPVLTETAFMLRFSPETRRDWLWWAHRPLDIDQSTAGDMPRIIALLDKYHDVPANFADASLVAMAERLDLSSIASVDRDCAIYRLSGKRRFENIFLSEN